MLEEIWDFLRALRSEKLIKFNHVLKIYNNKFLIYFVIIIMNKSFCINYDYIEFSMIVTSNEYFKNRFTLYKIVKESVNKISMIVYCSILQKMCFLKIKLLNDSSNANLNVYSLLKNNFHDNIEKIHDVVISNKFIYILSEYICGHNLFEFNGKIDKNLLKNIINQTFEGFNFIHRLNIIHGDIKLENILLTAENVIKIIDFDLSHICSNYICSKVMFGSENYIAPESFDLHIYSKRSDIWSFGILLYKFILGKFPYKYKLRKSYHLYIRNNFKLLNLRELDNLIEIYGSDIINIIKKMLNFVDEHRPLDVHL